MYFFIKSFSTLLQKLSLRSLDRLARALTFVFFNIFQLRKKIIFKNLDIAFGDTKTFEEKNKIAYLCFYHFMLTVLEFLYFTKGELAKQMKIVNDASLRKSLENKQGAYIIAMHMSNWEAAASGVAKQIKPVFAVVKNVGSPGINRFVTEVRSSNGMQVVSRTSTGQAVRAMFKSLKQGNIVAFILDQSRPGEPFLPFFNKPAKTNTSFASMWAVKKAPVFIAYSVRNSIGQHTLYVKDEVHMLDTGDTEKDVIQNSTHINEIIASCIRECPEQYFWLHDRWKGAFVERKRNK